MADYLADTRATDRLPMKSLAPFVSKLFSQVGGVATAAETFKGERDAEAAMVDALGDTLWYLAGLARRLDPDLTVTERLEVDGLASAKPRSRRPNAPQAVSNAISELGHAAAALLTVDRPTPEARELLARSIAAYIRAVDAVGASLPLIIERNLAKVRGRSLKPDPATLPDFDAALDEDEQLPRKFEISIRQGLAGQAFMKWNGVFIGDPLTDNIHDPDGYRFHDVFHFANAAVLHWSPAFRGLIMHKRKSDAETDEDEDGGRAIVVEEGLTNWLFSRAKELDFFDGYDTVPYEILKTIQQFVRGYEVQACPLKLWEDAILQGYTVFRQVSAHKGGRVLANRNTRRVAYKPLPHGR